MTRRRVIFTDRESGHRYATPEFNGDKQDFERFIGENGDSCTATWEEITELFRPVRTLEEFRAANEAAPRCYISSFGTEILPVEQLSDDAGVTADELLFLPVSEGAGPFTDREFMDRMLRAGSGLLADFLGQDSLVFDGGNAMDSIAVKSEIDAVFAQMPVEELEKYWRLMLDEQGENNER